MNEKKKYEAPECEVIVFERKEIITLGEESSSPGENGNLGD
jgi:hypothetical protein